MLYKDHSKSEIVLMAIFCHQNWKTKEKILLMSEPKISLFNRMTDLQLKDQA
jgi:hypothetical protein